MMVKIDPNNKEIHTHQNLWRIDTQKNNDGSWFEAGDDIFFTKKHFGGMHLSQFSGLWCLRKRSLPTKIEGEPLDSHDKTQSRACAGWGCFFKKHPRQAPKLGLSKHIGQRKQNSSYWLKHWIIFCHLIVRSYNARWKEVNATVP